MTAIEIVFLAFNYLGVFVFAVSGAAAAARQGMDLFGYSVIAFLPAVGGGTLRDLLLDAPIFWFEDQVNIALALAAAVAVFVAGPRISRPTELTVWADALGLAVFAVLGASKTLTLGGDPIIATMMGVLTAIGGGIIRDVVCNEVPVVLHREIYATAAFAGAGAYCLAVTLTGAETTALVAGFLLAFGVRAGALIWGWTLPTRRFE